MWGTPILIIIDKCTGYSCGLYTYQNERFEQMSERMSEWEALIPASEVTAQVR